MKIETERLIITEFTLDMAGAVQENSGDDDNRRFVPDEVWETTEEAEETLKLLISQYGTVGGPLVYPIIVKETKDNIGYVQLCPIDNGKWEIGYHIAEKYTGNGYAAEAVKAFLPIIARQVNIREIYGICLAENKASLSVMRKCGFENIFTGIGLYQGNKREIVKNVWRAGFTIRKLEEQETWTALSLAWKVFLQYESPDYSPEGTEEFRKCLHDEKYLAGIECYGAFDSGTLIGMVGIRKGKCHICFFFVDGKYHRLGIGTRLFERIKTEYPGKTITLNSSPYGLPFYQSLGFHETGEEQTVNGIRFTPMKYQKQLQMKTDIKTLTIRPETHGDYKNIVSLVLRSFREGTDYSDGTDIVALIEEIRDSEYYIPKLAFVAELDGEIVGHFLFSRFPLSKTPNGGHDGAKHAEIVMLAPVSVRADHLRQGIGSAMIKLGIEKVKEMGFKGIIVEGNYKFYNTVGFRTSSEYGIFPVSGYPMTEPRCQMCMELYNGSLKDKGGYVVYDMYFNA